MGDYLVVSLLNQQCVTVKYVNYLLHNKEQSTISKLLISLNRNYKIRPIQNLLTGFTQISKASQISTKKQISADPCRKLSSL